MSTASRSPARTAAEPEDLMRDFRGGGLVRFAILAIVVHAVVILAASVPWLQKTFLGGDTASLTEEQKLNAAVKEATASLQAIAKEHGVRPQDLGARFAGGSKAVTTPSTAAAPLAGTPPAQPTTAQDASPAQSEPKAEATPPAPTVPPGPSLPAVDDNVDLFK